MQNKPLINVLTVVTYVFTLWIGFAIGLAIVLETEGIWGPHISNLSIGKPVFFIIIGILITSMLVTSIVLMLLKSPLNQIDILNSKTVIYLSKIAFSIGLFGAIIYRVTFLVLNTFWFNLPH